MPSTEVGMYRIERVVDLIRDAGGEVVGRTRLQKLAYLLEIGGLGGGFSFEYRHYGPFSPELADAVRTAATLGMIDEVEQVANWGGLYSVFSAQGRGTIRRPAARLALAKAASKADPIELELAATAAFLADDHADPWDETARRKPQKAAGGRLEKAKELYERLAAIETPRRLRKLR